MDTHRHLDAYLSALRDRVLLLGGEAEGALGRASHALAARDSAAAHEVLRGDDRIDQLENEVDRLCVDVLALHQPAARDLRFVITAAKMAPVLERVADHACNIARAALDLNDAPELPPPAELQQMAALASAQLRAALDAFAARDARAARAVIERDEEVNAFYQTLFHDLIRLMTARPETTDRAARLLLVAKHLERVGDYVTDVCELTVYMTEAAVIKHSN